MFFFMYVIRIHESVDTLLIRRYNTLLTSFATFVKRNLYKTIKLPGFSKNSYLKKRVYSVHFDTGRKLIRCRRRIRCWGHKQGNSCYLVLIRNPSTVNYNLVIQINWTLAVNNNWCERCPSVSQNWGKNDSWRMCYGITSWVRRVEVCVGSGSEPRLIPNRNDRYSVSKSMIG